MEHASGEGQEQLYGIGAVARLTGLSEHTLRVWERRHGAVTLARTDGGRRLYTAADVERLSVLKRLIDRGETIGRIAALSAGELGKRMSEYDRRVAERRAESRVTPRVGVLGEFPGLALRDGLTGADVVVHDEELRHFREHVRRSRPDVLLLEIPLLDSDTRRIIADLRRVSGAEKIVAAYGFGRRADVEMLETDCDVVVRMPATLQEIERALAAAAGSGLPVDAASGETDGGIVLERAPDRRFSRRQLQRLAAMPTLVDCECPAHLVGLIERLTLFEDYSSACESRNNEDAALHAYLHATTGHARSRIEQALAKVIEAESLDVGPR